MGNSLVGVGSSETGEVLPGGGTMTQLHSIAQETYQALKSLTTQQGLPSQEEERCSLPSRIHHIVYERRINGHTEAQQQQKTPRQKPWINTDRDFHRRKLLGFVPDARYVWSDDKRKGRYFPRPAIKDHCWESRGGKDKDGRPRYCPTGYTEVPMNKLAWWLDHPNLMPRDIPSRLYHTCGNIGCVNPAHLSERKRPPVGEDGTATTDRRRENGGHNSEKRFCPLGHPLDGRNVYQQTTKGKVKRSCRQCRSARNARRQTPPLVVIE